MRNFFCNENCILSYEICNVLSKSNRFIYLLFIPGWILKLKQLGQESVDANLKEIHILFRSNFTKFQNSADKSKTFVS